MRSGISPLTLLCLALVSGVGCIQVDIPNPTYEVARGDNITLPCTFQSAQPNPSLVVVTWSVFEGEGETPIITYYSTGETDINGPYEGRVELDVNIATGKVNLKLFSVTLVDNKVFECRVQIPKDKTGKTADTARLVVLVAPSPPICKIEGRAEYGQNINLTCVSVEGSPPPVYKWESLDVNNRPRVPDPKTTDKGGILSLYNISKDTSGYFICTSTNKIRSANCNLTLAVMPPSMLGSVGQTAGIIAAVVAVVFILIIVIYCCCCRKKNKEEEYVMGERVEEYYDKDATQNGEKPRLAASDDERSERGTADGRKDDYEDRSERGYDRNRKENDDQHSDYDDRRSNFTDRRSDFDDRRSDFDDRRSDYSDRRDRYGDRNERYDDNPRRDDRRYDDNPRRDDRRYDDNPRRDDRRYDDNPRRDDRRYDDNPRRDDRRYDEDHDDRPPVPSNKPPRRD